MSSEEYRAESMRFPVAAIFSARSRESGPAVANPVISPSNRRAAAMSRSLVPA